MHCLGTQLLAPFSRAQQFLIPLRVTSTVMRVVMAFVINTLFNFVIGLMVAKFLGPEEYGRFALALAVAIVVQTALFDWVKLAATRLYSERARNLNPALRATLDVSFALLAVGLSVAAVAILLSGAQFKLSSGLITLALAASIANGAFDYQTALVRARFLDAHYARLVVVKNLAAFCLTGGGAFFFHSATMALTGACISIAGSIFTVRAAFADPQSPPRAATASAARSAMGYAFPIVAANVIYQLVPLFNRGLIVDYYGFAEAGQFSLAYDMGLRIVAAIGSALDVLLFQIAVRADDNHGRMEAKAQLARNMAVVLAIVAPACAGLWLTLPSVEQIIVPSEFRGPFAHYLGLIVPGLVGFALINYAINPIFQIAKRTAPLIAAALIGGGFDIVLVLSLPRGADASTIALVQAGMFVVAFVALTFFAMFTRPHWPSWRNLLGTLLAVAAMSLGLLPLRDWQPGLGTLALQVFGGAAIYGLGVAAFDLGGLRSLALARLRQPR